MCNRYPDLPAYVREFVWVSSLPEATTAALPATVIQLQLDERHKEVVDPVRVAVVWRPISWTPELLRSHCDSKRSMLSVIKAMEMSDLGMLHAQWADEGLLDPVWPDKDVKSVFAKLGPSPFTGVVAPTLPPVTATAPPLAILKRRRREEDEGAQHVQPLEKKSRAEVKRGSQETVMHPRLPAPYQVFYKLKP